MKKSSTKKIIPDSLKKILKIMRLTFITYLVGMVQIFALNSYSQQTKLNLNLKNATLGTVLDEIENQSEFYFMFNQEMVDMNRVVTANFINKSINEVLDALFTGTKVNYIISDRQIVLSVDDADMFGLSQQEKKISGVVTEPDGTPMPGVSVFFKETTSGTVTDIDGNFELKVPPGREVLVISFVGMKTQEINIKDRSLLKVTMDPDRIGLEEVVAIGYGTVKKKDLTGAVTQINADKLAKESTSNMTSILRGALPGLSVSFSKSAKGLSSPNDMMIRGKTSLREDNDDEKAANAPLVVIDGMIYYGDLSDINPVDIETFDILKDASSAAIYGARASNGVILITTKKGKKGKPVININTSVGVSSRSGSTIHLMNADEFIQWRIAGYESNERHQKDIGEGYYNSSDDLPDGISQETWKAYDGSSASTDLVSIWLNRIGFSDLEIENYKAGKTIDWEDYVYQTGITQDYNVSISGSSDRTSYYWSIGYTNNEGVIHKETFKTIRSRINLEANITDWLKVGTNTQFAVRDESPITAELNLYCTPYSSFYEDDGVTIRYAPSGNVSMSRHPWQDMVYEDHSEKYNTLNSKIYATLALPLGFSFTSEYITRFNWNKEYIWHSSEDPDYDDQGGLASRKNTTIFEWQINNILKWNKTFGDHAFDFTVVQNAEKYQYWYDKMERNYFQPNDYLGYHAMQAATADTEISSDDQVSTGSAYLARLNYVWKGKYMATGSFRRDGYSAFGQSCPWANFGSFALGWTISEENFFKVDWVDMLKLRASYGTNGNRGVGIYDALSNLATGKFLLIEEGEAQYVSQLYSSRMANENLKWESTKAYNLGIDFSLLRGRIKGNVETYFMKTNDLLMERQLPDITGYSSVYSNMGQVNNKGIELSLNTVNIEKNEFAWYSSFSLTHNKNEIVHLFGDYSEDDNGNLVEVNDKDNGWFIGHAVDEIWDYKILGIWQSDEEEEAAKYSREPGDFKLLDYNGDGYYTNEDKQFQGYKTPKFRLTFRNDFQYKNWSLSVKMYSFLGQKAKNDHRKNNDAFYDRSNSYNVPYWTPENPGNKWARVESYESGFTVWEKNSFVRIDNVALTYNLPKTLLNQFKIAACNISFVAQNPYVWCPSWSWMDPESQTYAPSSYSLKLNFTL